MTGALIQTTAAAAAIPADGFRPAWVESFVAFIDRGQRTTQTYLTNLRQFVAWLRYSSISTPLRADVIRYRDYLKSEHEAIKLEDSAAGWTYRTDSHGHRLTVTCKPNTICQYLRSVKAFFSWTAAEGLYPNIAANIHGPKVSTDHKKEALTPADVLKIENSIEATGAERIQEAASKEKDTAGRIQRATEQEKRLRAMYLLAVTAGLRTIEIERACIKDLEVKDGKAFLYIRGKGRAEADQRKALAPEVYAAIKEYLDARTDRPTGSSPLFVSTGNRSGGQRIAARTISAMLKKAMQGAGYDSERITAHSLRHTAGTAAMDISGDLYTAQKYMRHASPVTTEIYLHCDQANKEEGLARQIYAHFHGREEETGREKLERILDRLAPEKLAQLAAIAGAMA